MTEQASSASQISELNSKIDGLRSKLMMVNSENSDLIFQIKFLENRFRTWVGCAPAYGSKANPACRPVGGETGPLQQAELAFDPSEVELATFVERGWTYQREQHLNALSAGQGRH